MKVKIHLYILGQEAKTRTSKCLIIRIFFKYFTLVTMTVTTIVVFQ